MKIWLKRRKEVCGLNFLSSCPHLITSFLSFGGHKITFIIIFFLQTIPFHYQMKREKEWFEREKYDDGYHGLARSFFHPLRINSFFIICFLSFFLLRERENKYKMKKEDPRRMKGFPSMKRKKKKQLCAELRLINAHAFSLLFIM